jgi:serine/threonine-protein kinase
LDELGEEPTVSDEEWPVDERYVEPAAVHDESESARRGEAGEVVAPSARSRGGLVAAVLGALLAALVLLGAVAAWSALSDPSPAARVDGSAQPSTGNGAGFTTPATPPAQRPKTKLAVPDVTGLALADARAALTGAGLRVRVRDEASDLPRGQVLRQTPPQSEDARGSSVVVLTISSGSPGTTTSDRVTVPSVTGLTASSAVGRLRARGLVPKVTLVHSASAAGTVLSQSPAADAAVSARSVVRLRVARHAEVSKIGMPGLVGLTAAAARRKLAAAGLEVSLRRAAANEPEGTVIAQDPSAGAEVRAHTTVRITVSSGPASVAVPSVVGLDEASARDQLEAAGFVVDTVDEPTADASQDGVVTAQDPSGGTRAPDGATVVLTIARFG